MESLPSDRLQISNSPVMNAEIGYFFFFFTWRHGKSYIVQIRIQLKLSKFQKKQRSHRFNCLGFWVFFQKSPTISVVLMAQSCSPETTDHFGTSSRCIFRDDFCWASYKDLEASAISMWWSVETLLV